MAEIFKLFLYEKKLKKILPADADLYSLFLDFFLEILFGIFS
jgi:hypothetical protein